MRLSKPRAIRLIAITLSTLCAIAYASASSLTVSLQAPTESNIDYKVHATGTFNNWDMSEDSSFILQSAGNRYRVELPKRGEHTLFNLYKDGDWQNPLATEYGKPFTCGFLVDNNTTNELKIDFNGWAQDRHEHKDRNTLVGDLVTLTDFPMPQLNRSGDIYVYLPTSYSTNAERRYPVVYMLDGQNLFSEASSYSYEWQVDEIVRKQKLDIIVVGIANGPARWREYNPWDTVDFAGQTIDALGKQTMAFITQELKPHIDQNYRTLDNPEHTGFIGSSLGGLMALYAALEHADVFATVGAFSPSFSFQTQEAQTTMTPEQSNLIQAVKNAAAKSTVKIYFDVGEVEYGSFDLVDTLYAELLAAGYIHSQVKLEKDKVGRHCELDWARRLPKALTWMMGEL